MQSLFKFLFYFYAINVYNIFKNVFITLSLFAIFFILSIYLFIYLSIPFFTVIVYTIFILFI